MNNQYLEAMRDGRLPITVDVAKQTDGDYKAVWEDVNGKKLEVTHYDRDEAVRQVTDRVKLGIVAGDFQIQR